MTDLMVVLRALDASTATMRSLPVHNLRNAVNIMGNAPVHLALVAMTVRNLSAAHCQTERGDRQEKALTVTARKAGKESTAMSAPPIRHAMP
jgi:hypothetical protein